MLRIVKIRGLQGDLRAKELQKRLYRVARAKNIKLPFWCSSIPHKFKVKPNFRGSLKLNSSKYDMIIFQAAKTYDLPPALIKAVIHAESLFDKDAISHKGAQGLMQLMPDTAKEIGVRDPFDPLANILGGSKLLKQHINEFGSLKKALIAYNAGPKWVRNKWGMPQETVTYIRRVITYFLKYERQEF